MMVANDGFRDVGGLQLHHPNNPLEINGCTSMVRNVGEVVLHIRYDATEQFEVSIKIPGLQSQLCFKGWFATEYFARCCCCCC